MRIPDTIIPALRLYAPTAQIHLETPLTDLGIDCASKAVTVQCLIEEAICLKLPSGSGGRDPYQAWDTVEDIVRAIAA